jgi:O-Antigen ligase
MRKVQNREWQVRDGSSSRAVRQRGPINLRLSRILAGGLLFLLAALLVTVLFEGWLVTVLGTRRIDSAGHAVVEAVGWPKVLKNALYFALLGLAAAKLTVDRRWPAIRTPADVALGVLGLVMLAAGVFGRSSPTLIGEALFVYFRGVIVFYAWRALDPPWRQIRQLLWLAGGLIAADAAIAFWQLVVGYPSYPALGWVDLTWARINRAHALLPHPNDLGHVTGLLLLGLVAWFVASPKVKLRWWLLFALVAIGLGATQSRESLLGVIAGVVLIGVLRRGRQRRVLIALALVIVIAAAPLVLSPANRAEWGRRLGGVVSAVEVPSGSEDRHTAGPSTGGGSACPSGATQCPTPRAVPQREIRVLYAQQGVRLWARRPLLGYGVGQFGGIVAYQDDPNWNTDPRFGPEGFNRYGFNAKTVDSFWLHLLVETGALGAIAYLCWMFLIAAPALRATSRRGLDREDATHAAFYWAPAVLVFAGVVALFSPSLEDPLFPPLMFSVFGIAWVLLQRRAAESVPASEAVAVSQAEEQAYAVDEPQRSERKV